MLLKYFGMRSDLQNEAGRESINSLAPTYLIDNTWPIFLAPTDFQVFSEWIIFSGFGSGDG